MSSIPSTIVRPLQDKGTPAGPKRSGTQLTPDLLPDRVALQKGCHEMWDTREERYLHKLIQNISKKGSSIITSIIVVRTMTRRWHSLAVASLMLLLLMIPSAHAFSVEKEEPGPTHWQLQIPEDTYPIDGYGHHEVNPALNSRNSDLIRLIPSSGTNDSDWISRSELPSPREISNTVCYNPNGMVLDEDGLSDMNWLWGQFITHDIDFTLTQNGRVDGAAERIDIPVPSGDLWMDPQGTGANMIMMFRSIYNQSTGIENIPREYPNSVTGWIDGSSVYGSSQETADWLRTGQGGQLKVTSDPNGDLLPLAAEDDETAPSMSFVGFSASERYIAGDSRANEHVGLTAIHILFVREHNRIAEVLESQNPEWTDEDLYQSARKYVTALMQQITYQEYLPSMNIYSDWGEYDSAVDPSISNAFATLAFRMGHSQIGPLTLRLEENRTSIPQGSIAMENGFWDPNSLVTDGGIDPVLRGLAFTTQEANDVGYIHALRNMLFGAPGMGGMDMCAIDIQRGRDHGIPDYGSFRDLVGLEVANNWSDVTSDSELASRLDSIYPNVSSSDPLIGMYAEDHNWTHYFPEYDENRTIHSTVGPTMHQIIRDQFHRLRVSDPLFYEWDPDLSEVLDEIRNTTLTDIILRNTGIEGMVCLSMISEQHWIENSDNDFTQSDNFCRNENLNFAPGPPVEISNPTEERTTVLNAKMTERTGRSGLGEINLGMTSQWASYGPSIAPGDCNGDGLIDIAVGAVFDQEGWEKGDDFLTGRMHLMKNIGGNQFIDITEEAGLPTSNSTALGLTWADFDEDGDLDLHVSNFGEADVENVTSGAPNELYRNDGECTFTEIGEEVGVDNSGHSSKGLWADYDHDGDLDLYSMNFGILSEEQLLVRQESNILYQNQLKETGNANFLPVTIFAGRIDGGTLEPSSEGEVAVGDAFSIAITAPENPSAQMLTPSDRDPNGKGSGMSWAGVFVDMDGDAMEDIFVASDFGFSPFYNGSNSGAFRTSTFSHNFSLPGTGMGASVGDIEGDGDLDLCVSNFGPNYLWMQSEPTNWEEVGVDRGIAENILVNWDCKFLDVDLDGDLDLWFGVGKINPYTSFNNNSLYINDGNGHFIDGIDAIGLLDQGKTMGSTWADFDGDGDLDLVLGDSNIGIRFFENDAAQRDNVRWIAIDPKSTNSNDGINKDAIGSIVDIEFSNGKIIRQAILAGDGFTGCSVSEIRLGIPSEVEIEEIRIIWNDGEVTTMDKWTLNRINVQNYDPDVNLLDERLVDRIVFIIIIVIIISFLGIIQFKAKQIETQLEDDEQQNID